MAGAPGTGKTARAQVGARGKRIVLGLGSWGLLREHRKEKIGKQLTFQSGLKNDTSAGVTVARDTD